MIRKRMIYLVLAIMMLVFTVGCADSSWQKESSTAKPVESKEADLEDRKTGEQVQSSVTAAEISDVNAAVPYAGEEFIKSVFAAGETMLYVCGIKTDGTYFLGSMEKEGDVFQEFTVDMGEGMRVFNMAVDHQGKCHILWMSVKKEEINGQNFESLTYEKSYITVMNKEGRLEKETDVSEVFSLRQPRPFCFAVDTQGSYYFEHEQELIQITADGKQTEAVWCDGWIEGIGMGKSGTIYCSYKEENGERRLARLEGNRLSPCEVKLPEAGAIYAGIYPGTDTELLLFNKESGVLACDEDKAEVRISGAELPVNGAEIAGYGILSDGRTCLMEQKEGNTLFYYLPSGK